MAKRKREQPPALLPPVKRLCECPSRGCSPLTLQLSRKRKPEPMAAPEREAPAAAKRPKTSGNPRAAADFQCQKDEAFREYNSFHFWKTPLPDIDFSELVDEACEDKRAVSTETDVPEEMDG